ncbi:MAG: Methyltransferase type 12 [Rhodospirillales bacterium]|jgi:SAM-dependent methyltransferase|nr:Methyltransferase type 12 [Rhodospirillales bacterium]
MEVAGLQQSAAAASEIRNACPACGTGENEFFMNRNDCDLYKCTSCRTIYMFPFLDTGAAEDLYADSYENATTGYFAKVDKKLRRSRARVRRLQRYTSSGRFLDVGCNGGFVVEAATEAGFDAHGLDIDPVSIAYARQHYPENSFFLGVVERYVDNNPGKFDLIYSSEVIEHVGNVKSFVKSIAELMAPGGVLYLTTPDISHWRTPRDLTKWDAFGPPAHCTYFNPPSLIALLEEVGLTIVYRYLAFKPGIKIIARKPK